METPIQELRKEKEEFEQFKQETMQEIQTASVKLDTMLEFFDGYRDIKTWKSSLDLPLSQEDFQRRRDFIDEQIAFKQRQLSKGIVEKNPGYKGDLRQPFEIKGDVLTLKLQLKGIDIEEKVALKEQEIRDKLKEKDAELIRKLKEGS